MQSNLLPRVAAGDSTAIRECIDQYGGLVWSLARRYLGDSSDAEDAVQEIFIALWESAGRFEGQIAAEATFVAMIARRRLIDRVRAAARSFPQARFVSAEEVEATLADPRGATGRIEAALDLQRVARALDALGGDQRKAIVLSVAHGLSHQEVAETTGIPLGTVKTHIRRGLQRLRDLLAPARSSEKARS